MSIHSLTADPSESILSRLLPLLFLLLLFADGFGLHGASSSDSGIMAGPGGKYYLSADPQKQRPGAFVMTPAGKAVRTRFDVEYDYENDT